MTSPQHASNKPPQPPPAPDFKRRLSFYPAHIVLMGVLFLFPLLGLLGVFGISSDVQTHQEDDLRLEVLYNNRLRFQIRGEIEIQVENTGEQPMPEVTVMIARSYLDAFSDISFTLNPDSINAENYEFVLHDVQPSETRLLTLTMQADRGGQHRGDVQARTDDGTGAKVRLSTFIFP